MAGAGGGHTNLVLGLRENVTISYGGPFGDSGFFLTYRNRGPHAHGRAESTETESRTHFDGFCVF